MRTDPKPVFRFAPSPNGELHIGHAYSALLNLKMARNQNGKMLLRIEDIDRARCTPENETQMLEDLEWIGFEWDEPPRRQSEHFEDYRAAVAELGKQGLVFPSVLSRGEIKRLVAEKDNWPSDPDGAHLYPGEEHLLNEKERLSIVHSGEPYSLRLDPLKTDIPPDLCWHEISSGPVAADPLIWGRPVLARKDTPASYHIACVVDDALQGVTHVVRGKDLYHATALHRLLQHLLVLPEPLYHHHELVRDEDGAKLSKSRQDTSLRQLRDRGLKPQDVHDMLSGLFENETFDDTGRNEDAGGDG